MKRVRKTLKLFADYRHYRRCGYGRRRSWGLAKVTL